MTPTPMRAVATLSRESRISLDIAANVPAPAILQKAGNF